MKKYCFIILSLTFIFFCCENRKEYNREFVKEYKIENFNDFLNTCVYLRNSDEKGNYIYFISNLQDTCTSPYIVAVSAETNKVKWTSRKLLKNSCEIDENRLTELVLKFNEYKIPFLKVDKEGNAFFNLVTVDQPNLIRFSDLKYKTDKYRNWQKINDNWYERKD